jgi:four helix bundle protein
MATTKESANFPKEELYGMTMQLRCAAVSAACNVAEGAARGFDDGGLLAQVEDQRPLLLGLIRSLGLAKEGSHG